MIKGYKVFNPDWTCIDKQYTCPGKFEEDAPLCLCETGMHFCKKASDCFNYYIFDPSNHVAEVIAYGDVLEDGDKCCTDKLEIVREIPWAELLEMVNTGQCNTGINNSGDDNSGSRNSGSRNSGNGNSGHENSGDGNSGHQNSGEGNSGNRNSGHQNSGHQNSGYQNSGNWNSGSRNSGNGNSGHENSGNGNSGDWNKCNHSTGCFNTKEQTIYFFNKPSEWTYLDWVRSKARRIMLTMPATLNYVSYRKMTDEEKKAYPKAKTTGGYLQKVDTEKAANEWWKKLDIEDKEEIKALPNFDSEIFKEITGIDVDEIS